VDVSTTAFTPKGDTEVPDTKRLRQLIRVLRQVKKEKRPFDMKEWTNVDRDRVVPLLTTPAPDCGTASCAAGWAARDPWFIEQGFTFTSARDFGHVVTYERELGFEACSRFFDLSHNACRDIFGQHNSNEIDDAITRVKKHL